jgi:excisionase family DNA binding protein
MNRTAFSITTFCERNDVGRSTVYEEIKSGRLRAVKVGRRTLIREEDERAWLAALPSVQTDSAAA